jgi:toxin HigB-1
MEVEFRSRRLQRRYEQGVEAIRAYGPEVGRRYVQRIDALLDTESTRDLFAVRAFDLHPLTGDRSGQFAMRLTGRMRLVLTFPDERTAIVEEVVDYHG